MKLVQFNMAVADRCVVFITVAADSQRAAQHHHCWDNLIRLQRSSKVWRGHLHAEEVCVGHQELQLHTPHHCVYTQGTERWRSLSTISVIRGAQSSNCF